MEFKILSYILTYVYSRFSAGHCGSMSMPSNGAPPMSMSHIASMRSISSPAGSIQDLRISPAESALDSPISSPLGKSSDKLQHYDTICKLGEGFAYLFKRSVKVFPNVVELAKIIYRWLLPPLLSLKGLLRKVVYSSVPGDFDLDINLNYRAIRKISERQMVINTYAIVRTRHNTDLVTLYCAFKTSTAVFELSVSKVNDECFKSGSTRNR